MNKLKELLNTAVQARLPQHFTLFLIVSFFVVRLFMPLEWTKLDVVILTSVFATIAAIAFEVFQSDVNGTNKFDITPLKWLHKTGVINLNGSGRRNTAISWADVIVSTLGAALGSYLTQLI